MTTTTTGSPLRSPLTSPYQCGAEVLEEHPKLAYLFDLTLPVPFTDDELAAIKAATMASFEEMAYAEDAQRTARSDPEAARGRAVLGIPAEPVPVAAETSGPAADLHAGSAGPEPHPDGTVTLAAGVIQAGDAIHLAATEAPGEPA